MASPSAQELLHSYRHLYRGLLHAVQYAKPQRFVARDQLREAFRKGQPADFNVGKIDRTIGYLKLAAQESGLEHKILKNLLHTEWSRRQLCLFEIRKKKSRHEQDDFKKGSRLHYDMTVAMLNSTMGLCLR